MESTQSAAVPAVATAADESTMSALEQSSEQVNAPDASITTTTQTVTPVADPINIVSTSEPKVPQPLEAPKQSQSDAEMLPTAATTAVIIEYKETDLLEPTTDNEVTTTSESANAGALSLTLDDSTEAMQQEDNQQTVESTVQAMDVETETIATDSNHITTSEQTTSKSAGLSLLAAYDSGADSDADKEDKISDSDDETRSVVEVPVTANKEYRKQVVAVSSGSESDDSSTDSDSEGEYLTVLRKKIEKKINTEDCDDDDEDFDDDGERPRRRQPPKVRGEMLLTDLPPIQQLEITVPEDECVELGKVQSIVDQLVLVSVLPNSMLFDLDTVLFLDKGRKVLGEVFDVLGQVADPLYCVRFNSNKQIQEQGINIGDIVYCAPKTEHTQFVILSKLMQVRGSDASWEHDVEPPSRYIDYSDDEAERDARLEQRKQRQRERASSTDTTDTMDTSRASTSTAPRQRGRRATREIQQNGNYSGARNHMPQSDNRARSNSRDAQYNYHPSYNPGSWHSNYYHNYHQPAANFNVPPPGMHFPMPNYGYGMPPHPYAMAPPMMPMYPPYGHPPPPPPPPPNGGC